MYHWDEGYLRSALGHDAAFVGNFIKVNLSWSFVSTRRSPKVGQVVGAYLAGLRVLDASDQELELRLGVDRRHLDDE